MILGRNIGRQLGRQFIQGAIDSLELLICRYSSKFPYGLE
jgi:hypothetical protein